MYPQGSTGIPPAWPPSPGQPPRPKWSWTGLLGVAIGTVALVVAIVGVTRTPSAPPASVAASTTPSQTAASSDTTAANRDLCLAIAPLMTENDRFTTTWVKSGHTGSPERDAATKPFVAATQDWAGRIQPVIDAHPDADPYLRRTLQRFVDDNRLLIADVAAGPATPYDDTIYNDSVAAYGGPLSVCTGLGIKW